MTQNRDRQTRFTQRSKNCESLIRVKILHKEIGRNFVYHESKWSRMTCIRPQSNAWATVISKRLVSSILPGLTFSYSVPMHVMRKYISAKPQRICTYFISVFIEEPDCTRHFAFRHLLKWTSDPVKLGPQMYYCAKA